MAKDSTRGTWPDPDVQLIEDYVQDFVPDTQTRVTPHKILRIHMDVDITADSTDYRTLLANGEGQRIYNAVVTSKEQEDKRGGALLRALFNAKRKFPHVDPMPEPTSSESKLG